MRVRKTREELMAKAHARKQKFLSLHVGYENHYYQEHKGHIQRQRKQREEKRGIRDSQRPEIKEYKRQWWKGHHPRQRPVLSPQERLDRRRRSVRESQRRAYKANPEKFRNRARQQSVRYRESRIQSVKAWRVRNREYVKRYNRSYNESHRQERRATRRLWEAKNKERLKKQGVLRRLKNPEKVREHGRRMYRKHRDAILIRCRGLEAKRRGCEGTHTAEQWRQKVEYLGWRCLYCGITLNADTVTRDHFVPLCRGGTHYIDNIVPACRSCNCRKHKKTGDEFIALLKEIHASTGV